MKFGQSYELPIVELVEFGVYLDAEDLGVILLPRKFVTADMKVGDRVLVFLYFDSEDRPVATTQVPLAVSDEFVYLEAIQETNVGMFFDWGLDKDLLVPYGEQHRPMEVGKSYLLYVYVNPQDGLIVASSRVERFLDDDREHDFRPEQEVQVIISNSTDLGIKAIINHNHWGLFHKTDIFQRLSFGQSVKAFIKTVRPDRKIDLKLQSGQGSRDENAETVVNFLKEQGGFAAIHDKSHPDLIIEAFGMSKSAFKRVIGGLYKSGVIRIEKDGIHLI